ncbi:MAG TPA: PPK2 family polyphosphate kinase [Pyrinomonadaceae bacterium]|jgi:PPK2 family polyphosphate:nucleotide phosphotransferase|nr:PPK2 family polyphosphate kinase [Pyrinomonadaceae bacterium]
MDTDRFIYRPGASLADFDPKFTGEFPDEGAARERMAEDAKALAHYQDILMAHGDYGLLVLFQAMDGAGKDATIKHVMSAADPQGCEVKMFKEATEKEVVHDYLWRAVRALPARGQIGIFNRSYYEQVVAERVHPEKLERQQLPEESLGEGLWERRFRQINDFERYLIENGIRVLKFFLHLSREEQRRRLLERIERPEKRWKFSASDVEERAVWDEYMKAYEEALGRTSTEQAPWHVIPADSRWFARAAVASAIAAKLKSLHAEYPKQSPEQERELKDARRALEGEEPGGVRR